MEVRGVCHRQRLDELGRHAAGQAAGFRERFVEQRFRAEHAAVRQHRTAEQHAIRPHKTIVSNCHRRGRLTARRQVDAMRKNLRLEPGKRRERTDGHGVRAIDEMSVRDGRVRADEQLRPSFRFVREMP